jgi:hypothetical protein
VAHLHRRFDPCPWRAWKAPDSVPPAGPARSSALFTQPSLRNASTSSGSQCVACLVVLQPVSPRIRRRVVVSTWAQGGVVAVVAGRIAASTATPVTPKRCANLHQHAPLAAASARQARHPARGLGVLALRPLPPRPECRTGPSPTCALGHCQPNAASDAAPSGVVGLRPSRSLSAPDRRSRPPLRPSSATPDLPARYEITRPRAQRDPAA